MSERTLRGKVVIAGIGETDYYKHGQSPDSEFKLALRAILAAAKDAGFLDLALEFANTGRTDPRTLSRASRDLLKKDARFSLEVGRLAIQRILEGYGYELTGMDVIDAYNHFMAAAQTVGIASQARAAVLAMATKQPGAARDILIRQCSGDPQAREAPGKAIITEQRTWTRRSPTRH